MKSGDFQKAKVLTAKLQVVLRTTGHQTRLLQAKNWLYECALEDGRYSFAQRGFIGTRQLVNPATRVYLEATALLAVCYLRSDRIDAATPYIEEAIDRVKNIRSDSRRRQFHSRFLERLEEECVLAGLYSETPSLPNECETDDLAIKFLRTNRSQEELIIELGRALPKCSIFLVDEVRVVFDRRLPGPDRAALPPPLSEEDFEELGKRSESAIKRVAWGALCDKESELYVKWTNAADAFYDKRMLTGALIASCVKISIAPPLVILAALVALAMRFGAAVFCEKYEPSGLMISRSKEK